MTEAFDIAVIGGGPGGYTAAIRASQNGAKVCVIEQGRLGGVCLNWGCIPTKTLIEHIKAVKKAQEILALDPAPVISLETLIAKKNAVVANLVKGLEILFRHHQIKLIQGQARLISPQTIVVDCGPGLDKQKIEARNIIIATGSRPRELPEIPIDGQKSITSDQVFSLKQAPGRVLIVGAGAIGCEFALIFSGMGAQVSMVEMAERILPEVDEEISRLLSQTIPRQGVQIYTGNKVKGLERKGTAYHVRLQGGEEVEADCIITAVGRQANTAGIGLTAAGIMVERGYIKTNEHQETAAKGVFAVGDCVAGPMLAHKAAYDGTLVADNITRKLNRQVDYKNIPQCIFTSPEIGMVGLREKDIPGTTAYKTGKFPFAASGKAQAMGEIRGFVKILSAAADGRILGGHIVGPQAAELIAQIALAMTNGLSTEQFANTVYAHPTLGEAVKEAMEDTQGQAISIIKRGEK